MAWTTIAATDIDADSPLNAALFTKIKDDLDFLNAGLLGGKIETGSTGYILIPCLYWLWDASAVPAAWVAAFGATYIGQTIMALGDYLAFAPFNLPAVSGYSWKLNLNFYGKGNTFKLQARYWARDNTNGEAIAATSSTSEAALTSSFVDTNHSITFSSGAAVSGRMDLYRSSVAGNALIANPTLRAYLV